MPALRSIEIIGGPLDGRRIIWDAEVDCMMWTDGIANLSTRNG
jgi:hypothetical protein